MERKECLRGDVIKSYKKLVADNYPDSADKTNANYKELVRLIPADSGDCLYPGNKICQYMMNKIKYMNHRCLDGRKYKPTDVLRQLRQLRAPGGNIMTDAKFLQFVWNIFPKRCRIG